MKGKTSSVGLAAPPRAAAQAESRLAPLFRPLEDLLVSGGDARLTLSRPRRENSYGCTPFPRSGVIDFASSTASSISEEAYARAGAARGALMANAVSFGVEDAFGDAIAAAAENLLLQLRLASSGVRIVFAPSGTDAQLHALFLARALLARPVTTIVAGADQTGSGTAYTCTGRHFSQTTAGGWGVQKGGRIAGLGEDAHGIEIGFCRADGTFRGADDMDAAVSRAVEGVVACERGVLLQAMEASKFGWKAPSDAALDAIATRHAGRVLIVIDACQLRLSRSRLKAMLAKGHCVLITGSKFFTGPAFSGALLVPPCLSDRIAGLGTAPAGLAAYSSAYDWPATWSGVRQQLPLRPNFGQWLRWEAALEEMRLYYAVPENFRDRLKQDFQHALTEAIARASCLELLPAGAPDPTIFGVILKTANTALRAEGVAKIYHALRQSGCGLGQPVNLPALGTAALRFSLSARLIRQCWSDNAGEAAQNIKALLETLTQAVARLDRLAWQAGNGSAESV